MIVALTQKLIDTGLVVPEHLSKIEYVDDNRSGLYVLVSCKSQGQGVYFWRTKNGRNLTSHIRLGRTTDITLAAARTEVKRLRGEQASPLCQTSCRLQNYL